jgi:DNA-binding response OmpR family regulator
MRRGNAASAKVEAYTALGADSEPPTVLVVEDDEDTRAALAIALAEAGYLVLAAEGGRGALSILRQPLAPIGVVLLDVHLPDVDGTRLCARVRELYPDLPILICSGEAEPEEVAELVRLGATRYLTKPITRGELLAVVEAALPHAGKDEYLDRL